MPMHGKKKKGDLTKAALALEQLDCSSGILNADGTYNHKAEEQQQHWHD